MDTTSASLPPVVRALLRPESYPHPADDLRLCETHISWVVLAGPYAYKLKKPVNLGFLDFSTVERRAAACADEVRLNRCLCPDVYLGVSCVVERPGAGTAGTTGTDGRPPGAGPTGPAGAAGSTRSGSAGATFAVGGPGRPVEPVVWMRRLPEAGMLTTLLARGAADARLVRRLARHLARFHASAATGPGVDEHGGLATIRANWEENFAQAAPFAGRTIAPAANGAIAAYVERFLAQEGDLLARRVAAGRIREGHGDLHAGSVCVEGRRLHLFDCLEFNQRFRCADVAAEVAFLAMDLAHHGRADLAALFVDAYVRASGDGELRRLLPFYACYRAYVRGKVLCLRLAEPGLAPDEAAAVEAQAQAYFDLAWAYAAGLGAPGVHLVHPTHSTNLAGPARPVLVVATGLPASGKTTVARTLAGRFGLVHLESDVVRKELAGLRPNEHRYDAFGQGLYAPATTRRTYAALRRRAGQWLRSGNSVVLDATFGRVAERVAVGRLAARCRVPLVALVCRAGDATLRARLAARAEAGAVARTASDARLELWPALRAAFAEPVSFPGAAPVEVVDLESSAPLATTVARAAAAVRAAANALPARAGREPAGRDQAA